LTPLHIAARNGFANVVAMIRELDADDELKTVKDSIGWTPEEWAKKEGHSDVLEALNENKPNNNDRELEFDNSWMDEENCDENENDEKAVAMENMFEGELTDEIL